MAGEVLVHFEHRHFVLAEDLLELVVGRISRRFSGFCRLCERMYRAIVGLGKPIELLRCLEESSFTAA
jgi:hypothetical protein